MVRVVTMSPAQAALTVAEDIAPWVQITLEDDSHVFRCIAADCVLEQPSTGGDVRFDIFWTPPLTDSSGGAVAADWQSILAATIPPGSDELEWWLKIHPNLNQRPYPVRNFKTFPVDLPNRSLVRLDCLEAGATPDDEIALIYLIGDEVRIS
jgi:hypothetical protein